MPDPSPNRALVARRGYCDVSQRSLAYKTGLTENRIWRIENGVTSPTTDEQVAIADALDTTVDELFPQPSAEVAS